jgi:molybdate transport system substrate-binding protein
MKVGRQAKAASIGWMLLLLASTAADAAELKVLSALGMKAVVDDLRPQFERATGHRLAVTFATAGAAVERVRNGEAFDVVIVPRSGLDGFVKDGKALPGDAAVIARSGIGVAIRKGASKPDISSAEALKRALIAARTITYSKPEGGGASGIHFANVLHRLGIADEMKPKTVFHPATSTVGAMVASGEADLGVHQIQELLAVGGIEVVGPLPGELQNNITFSAVLMTKAKEPDAGRALISFLRTSDAAAVIKTRGMDPATP